MPFGGPASDSKVHLVIFVVLLPCHVTALWLWLASCPTARQLLRCCKEFLPCFVFALITSEMRKRENETWEERYTRRELERLYWETPEEKNPGQNAVCHKKKKITLLQEMQLKKLLCGLFNEILYLWACQHKGMLTEVITENGFSADSWVLLFLRAHVHKIEAGGEVWEDQLPWYSLYADLAAVLWWFF